MSNYYRAVYGLTLLLYLLLPKQDLRTLPLVHENQYTHINLLNVTHSHGYMYVRNGFHQSMRFRWHLFTCGAIDLSATLPGNGNPSPINKHLLLPAI